MPFRLRIAGFFPVLSLELPLIDGRALLSHVGLVGHCVGPALLVDLRIFLVSAPPPLPLARWYLDVVLSYLRSPAFEPVGDLSLRRLTSRALFFLAFAAAERFSGVHAISGSVGWRVGSAVLSFVPSFRAKSGSVSNHLP